MFAFARSAVRTGLVLASLSLVSAGQSSVESGARLSLTGPSQVAIGGAWSLTYTTQDPPRLAVLSVFEDGREIAGRFLRVGAGSNRIDFELPDEVMLEGVRLEARVSYLNGRTVAWTKPVSATITAREVGASYPYLRVTGQPVALGMSSAGNADGVAAAGDAFGIRGCSLGCSGTRLSLSCSTTDVHVNEEIRLEFTDEIDLASVNPQTMSLTQMGTGQTPVGTFSLSAQDPSVLIYRPLLTFDSSGNPIFGFEEDEAYSLTVFGTALDPLAAHIRSTSGQSNLTRVQCVLLASQGIQDVVPGPPAARALVDVVTGYDGQGTPSILAGQPANGAVNVSLNSDISLVFEDIMNPATLVNPILGTSNTIEVRVDPDGDLSDPSDQFELDGSFTLALDFAQNQTTAVFRPDAGLPAVPSELQLLKIVVEVGPGITDLASNALSNPGTISFQPEFQM